MASIVLLKKPEGTYIECGVKVKGRVFLTHEFLNVLYFFIGMYIYTSFRAFKLGWPVGD
jgi:hypothetical protein